jgi:hypothetical protein
MPEDNNELAEKSLLLSRRSKKYAESWIGVSELALSKHNSRQVVMANFLSSLSRFKEDILSFRSTLSNSKFFQSKNLEGSLVNINATLQYLDDVFSLCHDLLLRDFNGFKSKNKEISYKLNRMGILLADASGRINVDNRILSGLKKFRNFRFDPSDLQTGDVLAQIHEPEDFSHILQEALFNFLKDSKIAHVRIMAKSEGKIHFFDFIGKGMRYKEFRPMPGSIYIVLRASLNSSQRESIFLEIQSLLKKKLQYSTPERLGAYINVLLDRASAFLSRYRISRNIFESKGTYYCSEIIDEIYKKVGIELTPKSVYSNNVLPSDLLCSPKFKFMGLIFDDSNDTRKLLTKISRNPDI